MGAGRPLPAALDDAWGRSTPLDSTWSCAVAPRCGKQVRRNSAAAVSRPRAIRI